MGAKCAYHRVDETHSAAAVTGQVAGAVDVKGESEHCLGANGGLLSHGVGDAS